VVQLKGQVKVYKLHLRGEISMASSKFGTAIFLTLCFLINPLVAGANLGDTLNKAKSRGNGYKRSFGALHPIFETNKNGKIIFECWAAPAKQWSKEQVMKFAKKLVSPKLANQVPKNLKKVGSKEIYEYRDGTKIFYQVMPFSIPNTQGNYIGVEVQSPTYKGADC